MKRNFTVRRGALDGVEAFLSVARHRSFRKAAAELGVTPSAMSQAVRALELRVGAALFIRTTRNVGLSEAGERFHARARPAFEELVAASDVARDLGQRPSGLLRLTVPRAVVPILLEPLIASFSEAPIRRSRSRSPSARGWSTSPPADSTPASGWASSSRPT
ncbi:DNA-binding transcriptional LysR family regulator [Bradyrhizobium sp. LM2.7]